MSRQIASRWELTGELVAVSPVHVGGLGDGPPDLLHARDGLDRPVLPGSSLAGVIQAALKVGDTDQLWRPVSRQRRHGREEETSKASWIRIDDAPTVAATTTEAREHVSIDRVHAVAARGHLFTREVLPAGARFGFRMVVDDPGGTPAGELVERVAALLRGPGVAVGAATSRGLGRVRLSEARLIRFDLKTRAGIIATLRGHGTLIDLPPATPDVPVEGSLQVTIRWRPRGPLAVQVAAEGDLVDAFPLTTTCGEDVRLELPGSTIKGVLRSHAERITRTITGADAPETFLEQMRADGLGPVAALFGTAADRAEGNSTGRRGALQANTCMSETRLPYDKWQAVRLRQRPPTLSAADPEEERRAELRRLQEAVDELNTAVDGLRFVVAPHVAVDRWTGGAADSRLFATLEAHATSADAWQPIVLHLDVGWLTDQAGATEEQRRSALTLLLLVLRDLCDGWVGFGHGTTRGMGAVTVRPDEVRFRTGPSCGWFAQLDGRSLAEVLDDTDLAASLTAALMTELEGEAT